jgi:hypothetical protein
VVACGQSCLIRRTARVGAVPTMGPSRQKTYAVIPGLVGLDNQAERRTAPVPRFEAAGPRSSESDFEAMGNRSRNQRIDGS